MGLGDFPNLSRHVDDIAFIHSCFTQTNNHRRALRSLQSVAHGLPDALRMGDLRTRHREPESAGLRGRSLDTLGRGLPKRQREQLGAQAFCQASIKARPLNAQGQPINNLGHVRSMTDAQRRAQLDLMHQLNEDRAAPVAKGFGTGRAHQLRAWLIACKRPRPKLDANETGSSCNLRRRGQEVRPFCQAVPHGPAARGTRRAHGANLQRRHGKPALVGTARTGIAGNHRQFAGETDQPIAALPADLKQRGLLDSTAPSSAAANSAVCPWRKKGPTPGPHDHNPHAFTAWFAGGGVRRRRALW